MEWRLARSKAAAAARDSKKAFHEKRPIASLLTCTLVAALKQINKLLTRVFEVFDVAEHHNTLRHELIGQADRTKDR